MKSGRERTWKALSNEQVSASPQPSLDRWMPQNSLGPLFSPSEALSKEQVSAPPQPSLDLVSEKESESVS